MDNVELGIVFVDNGLIKKINHKYRHANKPTDILAFGLYRSKKTFVGDLIISVQKAKENARIFKNTFYKEIAMYIAHGVLHLAGYDDTKLSPRAEMERKQSRVLEAIWKKEIS